MPDNDQLMKERMMSMPVPACDNPNFNGPQFIK